MIVAPVFPLTDHPQGAYTPIGQLPGSLQAPSEQKADINLSLASASAVVEPHRYAWITSRSVVAGGTVPVADKFVDAQNVLRNFLMLRNDSAAANCYIEFGRQADATSTFKILPGQIFLFDTVVPQDDLYYFFDAANGVLRYSYSTIGVRNG